ncbi:MAG: hypothetical protein WBO33_06655, partial [Blautia wexlerae]
VQKAFRASTTTFWLKTLEYQKGVIRKSGDTYPPGLSDYAFVIILPVIIYFMFVCVLSIYNMMLGSKYILPLT